LRRCSFAAASARFTPGRAPTLNANAGLSAVVFDLDGTLIDSLPLTFHAFRAAIEPFLGRPVADEEIYARFGPADHEIVADFVGPAHAAEARELLMRAYRDGLDHVRFFPGVPEAVKALRDRGLRAALCTGRGRPSTDVILDRLGMTSWFEVTVTGEEAPRPKPWPDGILKTAALLGIPPAEILYAGDSVKDVDAGIAAGAFTVAALWAGTEEDPAGFARAHAAARTPADLLRIAPAGR